MWLRRDLPGGWGGFMAVEVDTGLTRRLVAPISLS